MCFITAEPRSSSAHACHRRLPRLPRAGGVVNAAPSALLVVAQAHACHHRLFRLPRAGVAANVAPSALLVHTVSAGIRRRPTKLLEDGVCEHEYVTSLGIIFWYLLNLTSSNGVAWPGLAKQQQLNGVHDGLTRK